MAQRLAQHLLKPQEFLNSPIFNASWYCGIDYTLNMF